jgi:hypothetical protein
MRRNRPQSPCALTRVRGERHDVGMSAENDIKHILDSIDAIRGLLHEQGQFIGDLKASISVHHEIIKALAADNGMAAQIVDKYDERWWHYRTKIIPEFDDKRLQGQPRPKFPTVPS